MTSSPQARVEIVDYDPTWPARFEQERKALRAVLTSWLAGPIEHIGSTAIPGLAAKPVIDIMAGVETVNGSRDAIAAAATLGYCYFPYQASIRHWMCKPSDAFRTHHLHLVPVGSLQWQRPIAFRNYLRAYPDVAAEYEQLKRSLALQFRFDREAYTEAKGDFIETITVKALASGYASENT